MRLLVEVNPSRENQDVLFSHALIDISDTMVAFIRRSLDFIKSFNDECSGISTRLPYMDGNITAVSVDESVEKEYKQPTFILEDTLPKGISEDDYSVRFGEMIVESRFIEFRFADKYDDDIVTELIPIHLVLPQKE